MSNDAQIPKLRHLITSKVPIHTILKYHGCLNLVLGSIILLTPHRLWWGSIGENHTALEYLRLYSCSLLMSSYLLLTLSTLKDPLPRFHITRSLVILHFLQTLVLGRAQLTAPGMHGLWGWMGLLVNAAVGTVYWAWGTGDNQGGFLLPLSGKRTGE